MGMFDFTNPGTQYLTPEQQQQAQTMGWLGAATNLANASASHPLSQGQQPTILQLLTGGLGGYTGGASEYQKMLADQYKQNSGMANSQKLQNYADNLTDEQRNSWGIPKDAPLTPEIMTKMLETPTNGGVVDYQVKKVMAENPNLNYTQALQLVQTGWRQGIGLTSTGIAQAIPGMSDAKGDIKHGETSGKESAEASYARKKAEESAGGKATVEAATAPGIAENTAIATAKGKATGDAEAGLAQNEAHYPELVKTVDDLRGLSKEATYTKAGKVYDVAQKELGLGATKGALARTVYESTVRDNLLPLLRQTFGAQFTEAEGLRLEGTLGDPDKTPVEKQGALDAFLTSKQREINAKQRQTGKSLTDFYSPDGIKVDGPSNPAGDITSNPTSYGVPPMSNNGWSATRVK